MWLRRGFYYLQFGAIVALPLWLLIGRGLVVNGPGWEFILLIFVCPILALLMLVVTGLTVARNTVRRTRAVSWLDVGVFFLWYGAIIAVGFTANTGIAALVVVASVAAFWLSLWQLFTETRRRVRSALGLDQRDAIPAGEYRAARQASSDEPGAGQIIRIGPGTR